MDSNGFKCIFCGGALCWNSDCNAYEISMIHGEDDTATASNYTCQVCGRDYEIIEPTKEERGTTYKDYWNE